MKRIIIIAAACAALASCTKAETEIVNVIEPVGGTSFEKGQTVTLTVSTPGQTKATSALNSETGEVTFKWEQTDALKVTVGSESATFTVSKLIDGGASAEFIGTMPASGASFDVQYPVTDPDIATQNYSSTEAIPHDKMKFTATGCPFASPSFTLTASNAALRLNLYGTNQTISKIVVKDASSNAYTLDISPAVKLPAEKKDSMAFFIVVPAGEYKFSAEIFDNALTPASICKFEPTNAQKFTTGNVLNMPAKEVKKSLPEGALSGVFSVGENTKVHFSQGNLRYTVGTPGTWSFYDNQYECGPSTYSAGHSAEISLFTWGYGNWSTTPSTYGYKIGSTFTDWGTAIDDKGTWCTLKKDEWCFLLGNTSPRSASLYKCGVTVCGKSNCLVIAPDDYEGNIEESYDATTWPSAESAGLVCLPAAGYRYGSNVSYVGESGVYWSSTVNGEDYAYYLSFNKGSVIPGNEKGDRTFGYSVRLVCVAQ